MLAFKIENDEVVIRMPLKELVEVGEVGGSSYEYQLPASRGGDLLKVSVKKEVVEAAKMASLRSIKA